jgi:hypothetical protein
MNAVCVTYLLCARIFLTARWSHGETDEYFLDGISFRRLLHGELAGLQGGPAVAPLDDKFAN